MKSPLVVVALALGGLACDPAITGHGDSALAPEPPPVTDGGIRAISCTDGQRSCNAAQTGIEECRAGAWTPVEMCQAGQQLCQQGTCTACGKFQFTIATMQACSLSVLPGFRVDAESFIEVGGQQHRVFAMTRWGKGHLVAWCDSTTLPELLGAFATTAYLGQSASPRVASFGYRYLCQPGALANIKLPASITYLGEAIPDRYLGDPKALARDWDVIIECGYGMSMPRDWAALLVPFVTQEGKGLLAAMDYEGAVTREEFDRMNLVTAGAGVAFNPLNLPWAPASTEVVLDCVPDTLIR